MDLILNNPHWLICHKTKNKQTNQTTVLLKKSFHFDGRLSPKLQAGEF